MSRSFWPLPWLVLALAAAGPARGWAEPIPVQSVLIRLIDEAEVPAREVGLLAAIPRDGDRA